MAPLTSLLSSLPLFLLYLSFLPSSFLFPADFLILLLLSLFIPSSTYLSPSPSLAAFGYTFYLRNPFTLPLPYRKYSFFSSPLPQSLPIKPSILVWLLHVRLYKVC